MNQISGLNAAAAAKYIANVNKTGAPVDVQQLFKVASSRVSKPDFNDPQTRVEARVGAYANKVMDTLLSLHDSDVGGTYKVV